MTLTPHDRKQLAHARTLANRIARQADLALEQDEPLRWTLMLLDTLRLLDVTRRGADRYARQRDWETQW